MTSPMNTIRERLDQGKLIILDGGTGTELEAKGATMHEQVWCATATLTHPDILRQVHEDYIQAGADIITTNTFSSNRIMLEPAGFGDRVAEINQQAVRLAQEARDNAAGDRTVVIAGSMSHQCPVLPERDRRDPSKIPSEQFARDCFTEMAGLLADAGVDLLLMEMMSEPKFAVPAIEAACATGLPVWVGLSCRQADDGSLVSSSNRELLLADAVAQIVPTGGDVYGIMHSNTHDTTPALAILRERWQGPLMAYPDSGYFKMPHWQFEEIIPPDDFAQVCRDWVENDKVKMVGGCCGLGVEHIQHLTAALRPS